MDSKKINPTNSSSLNLSMRMLDDWRDIFSVRPLGRDGMTSMAKENDLHFEVSSDFSTYAAPKTIIEHAGRFVGHIDVEGHCDPHILLAFAIFEAMEGVCAWGKDVLAKPEDWDDDQVACARKAEAARGRYEAPIKLLKLRLHGEFTIS